jgi:hypothetical protein
MVSTRQRALAGNFSLPQETLVRAPADASTRPVYRQITEQKRTAEPTRFSIPRALVARGRCVDFLTSEIARLRRSGCRSRWRSRSAGSENAECASYAARPFFFACVTDFASASSTAVTPSGPPSAAATFLSTMMVSTTDEHSPGTCRACRTCAVLLLAAGAEDYAAAADQESYTSEVTHIGARIAGQQDHVAWVSKL